MYSYIGVFKFETADPQKLSKEVGPAGSLEMVRHGNGQTSIFETFGNGQTKIALHWKWSDKGYTSLEMVRHS